jgi:hypothetical protein
MEGLAAYNSQTANAAPPVLRLNERVVDTSVVLDSPTAPATKLTQTMITFHPTSRRAHQSAFASDVLAFTPVVAKKKKLGRP